MIVFDSNDIISVGKNRIVDEEGHFLGYQQAETQITYSFRQKYEDRSGFSFNFGTASRFMSFIQCQEYPDKLN